MSTLSESFLFPNTQQNAPLSPEGSQPVDIPLGYNYTSYTHDNYSENNYSYTHATPLASPPDAQPWQTDVATLLFGTTSQMASQPAYSASVPLSCMWTGAWLEPHADELPGRLSGGVESASLSSSGGFGSAGFFHESPDRVSVSPSDNLFDESPELDSRDALSPEFSPNDMFSPNDLLVGSPENTLRFDSCDSQETRPPTRDGILTLLMSNPELWRQANLSKKGTYVCSHCTAQGNSRKFSTLASLAAHFDSYQVLRLCKCDYTACVWSLIGFSTTLEKVRHMRSQHSNKHYKCGACQRAFLRGDSLKRHLRLVHGRENATATDIAEMTIHRPFEPAKSPPNQARQMYTYEPVFDFFAESPP